MDLLSLSTFTPTMALRKATDAFLKKLASRQVRATLRPGNGLNVTDIHRRPIAATVIYRSEKDE